MQLRVKVTRQEIADDDVRKQDTAVHFLSGKRQNAHWRQLALYAGRLMGALLLMELMTHALYFNSVAKHKLWQRYAAELSLGAVHVGMTGFWVLMFVWLKVYPTSTYWGGCLAVEPCRGSVSVKASATVLICSNCRHACT